MTIQVFGIIIISKSKYFGLIKSPNRARELEAGEETFFCKGRGVHAARGYIPRPTAKGSKSGTESQTEPRKIRPPLKRQVHKSRGNGFNDRKRELLHCGGCKGFRFRFFLLMKPCGLWQACPAEGGKKQPGNGAEIMKTPFYIFIYRGGHCRGAVGACTV